MRNPKGEQEIRKWKPTENDFAYGRILMDCEDYSKVASTYRSQDNDILVCALIYSTLSRREGFKVNKEQFESMLCGELDTPKKILNNFEKLENLFAKYSLSKDKITSIKSIAENWEKLDLTKRIREDSIEKKSGYIFRDEISDNMFGIGYKFASLFLRMCGYENFAPIDKWAERYATAHGFVNKYPTSGLKASAHVECEKILAKQAKKYNVSLALFQATIYSKFSSWKKDSKISDLGEIVELFENKI